MNRRTGRYHISSILGEEVRAFAPYPLPALSIVFTCIHIYTL